ncbi:MAG: hypothetical protein ACRD3W_05170, partial [Terriglobales bacterium]
PDLLQMMNDELFEIKEQVEEEARQAAAYEKELLDEIAAQMEQSPHPAEDDRSHAESSTASESAENE